MLNNIVRMNTFLFAIKNMKLHMWLALYFHRTALL